VAFPKEQQQQHVAKQQPQITGGEESEAKQPRGAAYVIDVSDRSVKTTPSIAQSSALVLRLRLLHFPIPLVLISTCKGTISHPSRTRHTVSASE
jgi:hypothetical protein